MDYTIVTQHPFCMLKERLLYVLMNKISKTFIHPFVNKQRKKKYPTLLLLYLGKCAGSLK